MISACGCRISPTKIIYGDAIRNFRFEYGECGGRESVRVERVMYEWSPSSSKLRTCIRWKTLATCQFIWIRLWGELFPYEALKMKCEVRRGKKKKSHSIEYTLYVHFIQWTKSCLTLFYNWLHFAQELKRFRDFLTRLAFRFWQHQMNDYRTKQANYDRNGEMCNWSGSRNFPINEERHPKECSAKYDTDVSHFFGHNFNANGVWKWL